ncbi:ABC transporter permease subunit [Streptomyces sp. DSM 44915]|uniref:ABC transporter permease subunit n=1 Tax=Streptomyces chisholmiae TaxID=3075540 RepID=A0ABU2JV50_9ACTN|nr:ABC transporter permease subunit [Streptomyces sp. DSM 44915]MDT0268844.1 ABC transporter permease subunit [Streptomyces sp. DSM 44915]
MRAGRVLDRALRGLGVTVTVLAVLFVLAPVVLTVVLSFANDPGISFPPESWGTDRWTDLVTSEKWLTALGLSVRLGVCSALLTLLVSVLALLAIHRSRLRFGELLEGVSLITLIIPVSAYAVAMYAVFAQYELLGTFHGLVVAHAMLSVPLVMLVGGAALRGVPVELELVAITLGASRVRAWVGVTLRLALPALAGGFVMAFQHSFEEAVLINFIGGPGLVTLPKAIFDSVQFGSDPVITAIAAAIVLVSSTVVAVPLALARGAKR